MPDFTPSLHPRDRTGRWRDALRAVERDVPYGRPHRTGDVPAAEVAALRHLRPGETVVLPHGTALRRPLTDLRDPREFSVDLERSPGRPSLHNASLGAELADAEREHREAGRAVAASAFDPATRPRAQARADRARRRLDAARGAIDSALSSNARASLAASPGRPTLEDRSPLAIIGEQVRAELFRKADLSERTVRREVGRRAAALPPEQRERLVREILDNAGPDFLDRPVERTPGRPPISEEERRRRIRAAQRGPKPPLVGDIFTAIGQAVEVVSAREQGRQPARLRGAPPVEASPGRPEPAFPRGGISIISGGHRMGPYSTWEQAADQLLRERERGSTSARAVTGLTDRAELSPEQQRHLVEVAARRALRTQEARLRDRERLLQFLA